MHAGAGHGGVDDHDEVVGGRRRRRRSEHEADREPSPQSHRIHTLFDDTPPGARRSVSFAIGKGIGGWPGSSAPVRRNSEALYHSAPRPHPPLDPPEWRSSRHAGRNVHRARSELVPPSCWPRCSLSPPLRGRAPASRRGHRRAEAVAQGHADARRPVRPGARHPAQPLPRLPPDRPVRARVGRADLRRARLLRRRRQRRRDLGRGGHEVAGAPLAGQARPLDLARVVREGPARRRRPEGDGRGGARRGRGHGLLHRPPHRQEGPRLPGARAAAVRRRPLPALRRHAASTSSRPAPDAPETLLGYADFDGTVATEADRPPQDLGAPRARLAAGRPDLEGRQGQGPDRRPQLPREPRRERLLLPDLQRRRRRRQRLAVRRARSQAPLRLLEARPVAGRLRPRAVARPLPALQDAGDGERRPEAQPRAHAEARCPEALDGGAVGRRAAPLLPRARRPLRPRARPQLEPRRGEHPDARRAAGDGGGVPRARPLRAPRS